MMYYGPGMGGWMMVVMIFANLLFWTVVLLGAVVAVRSLRRRAAVDSDSYVETPQELLAGRFARGEISEDEYLHALSVLSDHARPRLN